MCRYHLSCLQGIVSFTPPKGCRALSVTPQMAVAGDYTMILGLPGM